jgi:hypothetical protein
LPALAADLVSRRVTAIFANSPSVAAVKGLTNTIPIVFLSGDDPVRLGFVASLNRPGGNVTGVNIFSGETATKRLGLLRELVPHASKIAILINSSLSINDAAYRKRQRKRAAEALEDDERGDGADDVDEADDDADESDDIISKFSRSSAAVATSREEEDHRSPRSGRADRHRPQW